MATNQTANSDSTDDENSPQLSTRTNDKGRVCVTCGDQFMYEPDGDPYAIWYVNYESDTTPHDGSVSIFFDTVSDGTDSLYLKNEGETVGIIDPDDYPQAFITYLLTNY